MKIKPAYLLILIATLIWGANSPIMKIALTQVPLFSLAFIRMAGASIILLTLMPSRLKIKRQDLPQLILAAVFGATLNLSLYFAGLKLTSAIDASLLIASVPIFTVLAAHFYLKEKMGTKIILAALVAAAGVAVIIGLPGGQATLERTIGNVLILLSSLSWVIHELFSKKLLKTYGGGTIAFYVMAIAAATFLPLAVFEFFKSPYWISAVTPTGAFGIFYGIIFSSLIAYWAWQKGLAKLPAGEASFFFYLDPVSGAALSIILLGEKLTPTLILGGVLIFAGIFLAEYKRKRHPLLKG